MLKLIVGQASGVYGAIIFKAKDPFSPKATALRSDSDRARREKGGKGATRRRKASRV